MGHNVNLCEMLDAPKELLCPKCHIISLSSFDEYDIDCNCNPEPGVWQLRCYCGECEHEWQITFHVDLVPEGTPHKPAMQLSEAEEPPQSLFAVMRSGGVECVKLSHAEAEQAVDELAEKLGGEWVSDLDIVEHIPKAWAEEGLHRLLARIDDVLRDEKGKIGGPVIEVCRNAMARVVKEDGPKD